jgi:CBS domain containing-hemolysin-like protein
MSDAASRTAPSLGARASATPPGEGDDRPPLREPGREKPSGLSGFFARLNKLLFARGEEPDAKEEIEDILKEDEAEDDADLTPKERAMLKNLLAFGELTADDLMVPRADIVAVDKKTSLEEILKIFAEAQHSRLPVYDETLDRPLGMVHLKDVVAVLAGPAAARAGFALESIRREVLYVSPASPAIELLLKMQAKRMHLALVVDEYGGVDGLLSIEDLIEQIVGDIDDEHDTDEDPAMTLAPDGAFDADARVALEDVEAAVGLTLVEAEDRDGIDTLGGLVTALAGRVPQTGETIRHKAGIAFEVADASPRLVRRVRVRRAEPASEGGPA